MCLGHDTSVRQHYKSEHWAPCCNQTPSWYDWKIVESDVKPEYTHTLTGKSDMIKVGIWWLFRNLHKKICSGWSLESLMRKHKVNAYPQHMSHLMRKPAYAIQGWAFIPSFNQWLKPPRSILQKWVNTGQLKILAVDWSYIWSMDQLKA